MFLQIEFMFWQLHEISLSNDVFKCVEGKLSLSLKVVEPTKNLIVFQESSNRGSDRHHHPESRKVKIQTSRREESQGARRDDTEIRRQRHEVQRQAKAEEERVRRKRERSRSRSSNFF